MKIDELLNTIDTSKMEREGYTDIYEMCSSEFDIHEWITQPEDNVRLTCCYYHTWMCTDTYVGLRVWYLDNEPVCISWKPYRKSREVFTWIDKSVFTKVYNYLNSLRIPNFDIQLIDDDTLDTIISGLEEINYKEFETKNIIE